VPSNIVAEVEVDDAEAAMQLLHDSCQSVAPDSCSGTSSRASSQSSTYLGQQQGTFITGRTSRRAALPVLFLLMGRFFGFCPARVT